MVRLGFSMLSGSHLETSQIASVSVRAVPWAFVVSTIRFGTNSLLSNANLVTKIYMPREIYPVAAMLSQLLDFAVASLVLIPGARAVPGGIQRPAAVVPLLIAMLVLLVTGLSVLLSAASLFFRDVKYLVEVILTFAIFFTPVFYEASMFAQWAPLLMLNPRGRRSWRASRTLSSSTRPRRWAGSPTAWSPVS